MADTHSKSFFGTNTGLILSSPSRNQQHFFIRCIKKKDDGTWEKPTAGEGKVIKCSLDEAVMILEVLNRKQLNWATYHDYKDIKTNISFGWKDDQTNSLWINIAQYSKMLNFAQAEIFRLLLTHILMEKIKYATQSGRSNSNNIKSANTFVKQEIEIGKDVDLDLTLEMKPLKSDGTHSIKTTNNSPNSVSQNISTKDRTSIQGMIKGETGKALLIQFESDQEVWIPKSTIHSQFSPEKLLKQSFLIDNWILTRNKIILAV